jgi:adenine/guanine phosphoribosyltransferase-like PRPP-binding protein
MKISYTLNVADLKRTLIILRLTENLSITSFILFGDTELVVYATLLLALDEMDAARIKGKRIGLIDDMISTRTSLSALGKLLKKQCFFLFSKNS